jgi:hypothetical protein
MEDFIQFSVRIPCPAMVLWWIIGILLTGSAITATLIVQASRFSIDADGKPMRLQRLRGITSASKLQQLLDSLTPQTIAALRKQLRIDFVFMPFFYLMLCCISLLVWKVACPCSAWVPALRLLCWVPLGIWFFNLLEDLLLSSAFRHHEGAQPLPRVAVWGMAIANKAKWGFLGGWVMVIVSHGINWLILRYF